MFECLKVNAMPPPPPAGKCYVMPFPVKVSRPRCPAPLAHPPALSTVCALRRGMVCWPSPLTPLLAQYGLPPMCVEGQTPDSPQHVKAGAMLHEFAPCYGGLRAWCTSSCANSRDQ